MACELSVRERDADDTRGGGVRAPRPDVLLRLAGHRRLLLLVHGYNNDKPQAREAYTGFEALQRRLIGGGADYAQGWTVVPVYWPGEADFGLASALFYPWIVKNARESGRALALALHELAGAQHLELRIVSHSLGCRVVAELLKALPAGSHVRVSRVVFMAAAVGLDKLEDPSHDGLGAHYGRRIGEAAMSLYSGHDWVLAATFPLGQTLAPGDEGFMPMALGHALWTSPRRPAMQAQTQIAGAGHSDYWGWRAETRDAQGLAANAQAREALRLEPLQARHVAGRILVSRQTASHASV